MPSREKGFEEMTEPSGGASPELKLEAHPKTPGWDVWLDVLVHVFRFPGWTETVMTHVLWKFALGTLRTYDHIQLSLAEDPPRESRWAVSTPTLRHSRLCYAARTTRSWVKAESSGC